MDDTNKIDLLESVQKIVQILHKNSKLFFLVLCLVIGFTMGTGYIKYRPYYSSQITFTVTKEINGYTYFRYNTEAVEKILDVAFSDLNLHRVVAHVQEENMPSIRLLVGLGFEKEGISRHYLCLNGVWTDHLQYSLIAADSFL